MATATVVLATQAAADPWKDESGHGRHGHERGEWKQEFYDGPCKVDRKWEPSGEYKEEVKCHGRGHGHAHGHPAPVYVPAPSSPSLTIVVPLD